MSVIDVSETPEKGSAESTATERKYTRVFRVVMSSTADGPLLARDASGIPLLGEYYLTDTESDLYAYVESKRADRVAENAFDVTVSYSSIAPDENNSNPLTADVQYTWTAVEYEEPVDRDINNVKILTTANEPFLPGSITKRVFNAVFTITRNELSWDGSLALEYLGKINNASFLGGASKTVMLTNISPQFLKHSDGTDFVRVSYEFTYDRRTFTKKILNQGTKYKHQSDGLSYLITERNEQGENIPVTTQRLLKENGDVLPEGDAAHYIEKEIYDAVNFGTFGF